MKRVKREDRNNDGLSDGDEEEDEEYDDEENEEEEEEEDAGLFKNQNAAALPTSTAPKINKAAATSATPTESTVKVEALQEKPVKVEEESKKRESPVPSAKADSEEDEEDEDQLVAKKEEESDSDDDNEPQEIPPEDIIVGQWEKDVTRTKNKFKLNLLDVMIRINGKDFILKKLNATI